MKQKVFYNWNKCKSDYKMAGNHWCLKNMIKEDTLENIENCKTKGCTICDFEKDRLWEIQELPRKKALNKVLKAKNK